MNKKTLLLSILALLAAFAAGIAVTVAIMNARTPAAPMPSTPAAPTSSASSAEETEPIETLTDSIHLPGYSDISLAADTCQQTIVFPNPPENFCFIRVHLELTDGTVLWESGITAPGEMTEPMELLQPLETGRYEARMVYECFRNEDGTGALNGAAYELNLNVS